MAALIQDDAQLRRFVPNQIAAVKGEDSLFDRLQPWLAQAEQWVVATFATADFVDSCRWLAAIAAHEAVARAIPALDLVLTANGFAVVSNQNLAPASKERVERLVASHLASRDRAISLALDELRGNAQWRETSQGEFFLATLFPTPAALNCGWDDYLSLRPKIIQAEAVLAHEYISPELMAKLRSEPLPILEPLRAQVKAMAEGRHIDRYAMVDIVQTIRSQPDIYPEWHNSETAQLFTPPVFNNEKQASGYFF